MSFQFESLRLQSFWDTVYIVLLVSAKYHPKRIQVNKKDGWKNLLIPSHSLNDVTRVE